MPEKCLIYEVKCTLCDAAYIGNTQQTFKKRMDGNFSDVQHILKNGQKLDSLSAHYGQHFKSTTSQNDFRKRTAFKLVKKSNPIKAMESFTKPNYNIDIFPGFEKIEK